MALLDRDVYIRNYITGVLVSYFEKGSQNMCELANELTQAAIEAYDKWREESLLEEFKAITEDVSQ